MVRIFNTYGPNMALDDGRVVSNFVAQALTGQPLTIFGDGQQTRSFQYVSDLIEGAPSTGQWCLTIAILLCSQTIFECLPASLAVTIRRACF